MTQVLKARPLADEENADLFGMDKITGVGFVWDFAGVSKK
jgi:hypothetical protein